MGGYLIVAERLDDGTWWDTPNSFLTEAEAVAWAKTESKPPEGFAWMIYRLSFEREASELNAP